MPRKKRLELWAIEARAFAIPFTPFTHNFWALTSPEGKVTDQLHGLAVDPKTGTSKAIGNSSHLLLAVNDASILWSLQPGQPSAICATGDEASIRNRWQAALDAIPAINALEIPYPDLWEHGYKKNSNSIFNTLGQIMGFTEPSELLPTSAPGVELVISQDIIDRYGYA